MTGIWTKLAVTEIVKRSCLGLIWFLGAAPEGIFSIGGIGGGAGFCAPSVGAAELLEEPSSACGAGVVVASGDGKAGLGTGGCTVEGASGMSCAGCELAGGWP